MVGGNPPIMWGFKKMTKIVFNEPTNSWDMRKNLR